jgi:threonine/homoserine/homoserine lactone efflux protein
MMVRTGEGVYALWVVVAVVATLFLSALLRARMRKDVRYQQARNGVVYVLLTAAAVYAAYRATMG